MPSSSRCLPVVLLGASAWVLSSLHSQTFVTTTTTATNVRGRTAMRGFKEEFKQWKSTLTADETELVLKQTAGEYDKKYRKSEEYKKELPKDKIDSFSKVLQKFFEAEKGDSKKDPNDRVPNYNALRDKANSVDFDFSLKFRIETLDRQAQRRYRFNRAKFHEYEQRGEVFPPSSPLRVVYEIPNDTPEEHQHNLDMIEHLKKSAEAAPAGRWKTEAMQDVKNGVPPQGTPFNLWVPEALVKQYKLLQQVSLGELQQRYKDAEGDEAKTKEVDAYKKKEWHLKKMEAAQEITKNYVNARDEVEGLANTLKQMYRDAKPQPGKTKADVAKMLWKALEEHGEKPPPLDPEFLAMLSKEEAAPKYELEHPWGKADVLYQSMATDSYGDRYLLGIFETKEEARKAFDQWNKEYEKASKDMKVEMDQWAKQEQAKMDSDATGSSVLLKKLEEVRR